MTTTVKVHVNGDYRATVVQRSAAGSDIIERIDGDTPGGRARSFNLPHPAAATFEVKEQPLTDEMKAARTE